MKEADKGWSDEIPTSTKISTENNTVISFLMKM